MTINEQNYFEKVQKKLGTPEAREKFTDQFSFWSDTPSLPGPPETTWQ